MWPVTTISIPLKRLISFVIPHDPTIVSLADPETSANNDCLTIQGTADTQALQIIQLSSLEGTYEEDNDLQSEVQKN